MRVWPETDSDKGKGESMKRIFAIMAAAFVTLAASSAPGAAQSMMKNDNNPTVGGAAMYRSKNIVENALNSPVHTTLVAAVKAAGLVETLSGKGPFTVFAPTDSAFGKLPEGTVGTLVQPENKATLTKILTYHVVAGKMDAKKIMSAIKKGGGSATLTTVSGDTLTAYLSGDMVMLRDEKGGTSTVTTADVYQKNGVIHVIDTVLMPE